MECSPRGNKGYKYGGAIQNMLLHRNISGAPLRRARNRLDRAANSSIATPVGFLRRLRRLACEVAVGGEDDCLMALKLFPIYFDNEVSDIAAAQGLSVVHASQIDSSLRAPVPSHCLPEHGCVCVLFLSLRLSG